MMMPKIALLATGDEIIHGDILNTNSQETALQLFNQGIQLGNHLVASDSIQDIEKAMRFLLDSHQGLIITGGLGPTSDDLTRFALSNVVNKPLKFDEPTWDNIVQRLKNAGYDIPPASNRQQALFPEGAIIIPNPNGTAAGCMLQHDGKWIFMLPGPPMECLPMLHEVVIPTLRSNNFQQKQFHQKWLLFGVSEGEIAEKLDALAKGYDVRTGYRIWYPYIEFKIFSTQKNDFDALIPQIQTSIADYILIDGKHSASELLKKSMASSAFKISIHDQATGGLLENTLLTPETYTKIKFSGTPENIHIETSGLAEFWTGVNSETTHLEIIIQDKKFARDIPLRGLRVKQYAVELICKKIYQHLFINN